MESSEIRERLSRLASAIRGATEGSEVHGEVVGQILNAIGRREVLYCGFRPMGSPDSSKVSGEFALVVEDFVAFVTLTNGPRPGQAVTPWSISTTFVPRSKISDVVVRLQLDRRPCAVGDGLDPETTIQVAYEGRQAPARFNRHVEGGLDAFLDSVLRDLGRAR